MMQNLSINLSVSPSIHLSICPTIHALIHEGVTIHSVFLLMNSRQNSINTKCTWFPCILSILAFQAFDMPE